MKIFRSGILGIILLSAAFPIWAATTKISYQGQLREAGVPVTANKTMTFRIYTSSTGGASAWDSGAQTVSVLSGVFRTLLEPTGVNWESALFLEVQIESTILTPREELTASPFAVNSQLLQGKAYTSAASAPLSPDDGDLWFNTSNNSLNIWASSGWDMISSGGSGGATVTVENNDVVVEASASRIDFSGTHFAVTSSPSGEANVALANGAVGNTQIAANAAIQLSKLEKDPSQDGTVNLATNPVDWTMLKSVPADFSDGVDNLGGGSPAVEEGNVVVDGAVGSFDFQAAQFNVTQDGAGEADISLEVSSITLQGNTFNAANRLVQLDSSGHLPALSAAALTSVSNSALDTSSITKQGNTFNVANRLLLLDGSALVPNANLDTSSVTKQGNTFNSAGRLALLDSSAHIGNANIDTSSVTKQGNAFNAANKLALLDSSGLIPNSIVDNSSVTKAGNTFNGNNQLVKVGSSGELSITGWSSITRHMTATKSINFGATAIESCEFDDIGVANADTNDSVFLSLPKNIAESDAHQIITAYVESAGVVRVRRCNPCVGEILGIGCSTLVDAPAGTVRVDVWKH